MGLKLLFLNWWTPNFIIRKEVANVSEQTSSALQTLLAKYAPQESPVYSEEPSARKISEQRANMAQTHRELVEKLETVLGRKEAVKLGRDALFDVGRRLGEETRHKLGVSDNPEDLEKAAKILYRILGIDFTLKWQDSTHAIAVINRCALADRYSALTCEVLSATDEGVIRGLQPNVKMHFEEYITSGCKNCKAAIHFNKQENKQ
jgi:predicted ArsR family transcriptional regulator